MSIRLLSAIFVSGVLSPVDGSTLSLSAALEADLVNQGKAVWVVAPPLTASEATHAAAHANMQPPTGVSIILAQSAIPMILPSSGTMGANGALTGLTALPYNVFPQPCYMYFPAGKVYAGSLAGMYYASITAATTATVYNNQYSSGVPTIPASPTPVVDAGPGAYTQATSEITVLAITIPGGLMGENGSLRVGHFRNMPNNANNKTHALKLGSADLLGAIVTTTPLSLFDQRTVYNKNNQARQVAHSAWSSFGNSTAATAFFAQNTAVDISLSFRATLAVATDFVTVEGFTVEVLPG